MERDDSISFSSVIVALLLLDRHITSVEIVNFLSRLECEDIEVSDNNDDVDDLLICVLVEACYSYSLKESLRYDTVLFNGVTVHGFLKSFVDDRVLKLILDDNIYSSKYLSNFSENKQIKQVNDNFNHLEKIKKLVKRNSRYSFLSRVP